MKILQLHGIVRLPDDFHGDVKDALGYLARVKTAGATETTLTADPLDGPAMDAANNMLHGYMWRKFLESQQHGNALALRAGIKAQGDDGSWIDHGQVCPAP